MAGNTALSSEQLADIEAAVARVEAGRTYAAPATELIISCGFLAVGTAESTPLHVPQIPWTAKDAEGNRNGWRARLTSERSTQRVIIATKVARLAVFTAFGGNPTIPNQRYHLGKTLTPPDLFYDRGTHGYDFNPNTGGYDLEMHEDLAAAIRDLRNSQRGNEVIGAIDFVSAGDPAELLAIPNEPGNFGITGERETLFTIPVRVRDAEGWGHIGTFHYDPIPLDT